MVGPQSMLQQWTLRDHLGGSQPGKERRVIKNYRGTVARAQLHTSTHIGDKQQYFQTLGTERCRMDGQIQTRLSLRKGTVISGSSSRLGSEADPSERNHQVFGFSQFVDYLSMPGVGGKALLASSQAASSHCTGGSRHLPPRRPWSNCSGSSGSRSREPGAALVRAQWCDHMDSSRTASTAPPAFLLLLSS